MKLHRNSFFFIVSPAFVVFRGVAVINSTSRPKIIYFQETLCDSVNLFTQYPLLGPADVFTHKSVPRAASSDNERRPQRPRLRRFSKQINGHTIIDLKPREEMIFRSIFINSRKMSLASLKTCLFLTPDRWSASGKTKQETAKDKRNGKFSRDHSNGKREEFSKMRSGRKSWTVWDCQKELNRRDQEIGKVFVWRILFGGSGWWVCRGFGGQLPWLSKNL